ncbi:MAG: hypothetical protein IKS17_01185 [Firmicutes bacterium]|nr:hypothetical protein [Bacillota bacterium]
MKKFYEIPEIDVTVIRSTDIITVSTGGGELDLSGDGISGDEIGWN